MPTVALLVGGRASSSCVTCALPEAVCRGFSNKLCMFGRHSSFPHATPAFCRATQKAMVSSPYSAQVILLLSRGSFDASWCRQGIACDALAQRQRVPFVCSHFKSTDWQASNGLASASQGSAIIVERASKFAICGQSRVAARRILVLGRHWQPVQVR
jgi:hypothetical protein